MITLEDMRLLEANIASFVSKANIIAPKDKVDYDPEDCVPVVTPEVAKLMSKSLTNFVAQATMKFLKGQKEHGGDIRDRSLEEELESELFDFYWYSQALFHWPPK